MAAGMAAYLPAILRSQVKDAFRGLGFADIRIGQVKAHSNTIVFSDIDLDKDGFSTLAEISVTFDPQTIFRTGRLDELSIDGMTLTALLETDGGFSMAGWSPPEFEPFLMPVNSISFDNIVLDIDTMQGALRLRSEGNGVVGKDGTVDIQGTVSGDQNQLQISSSWNGSFAPDGAWILDCQINRGRINFTDITASRIGGWISMGMESIQSPVRIGGQVVAGKLGFGPVPLQNVSAIVKGTPDDYRIILNAYGGGTKKLELNAEFGKTDNTYFGDAKVNTPGGPELLDLISAIKQQDTVQDIMPGTETFLLFIPAMEIDFSYIKEKSPRTMHYPVRMEIRDVTNSINVFSKIDFDLQKKTVSGSIKLLPVHLPDANKTFSLEKLAGINITKGIFQAAGEFFIDLQQEIPAMEGPLELSIEDLSISSHSLHIENVNTRTILSNLAPPETDKTQKITIERITSGIDLSNGEISFRIHDFDNLEVTGIKAEFAGGSISLSPVDIQKNRPPARFTINLDNLDLAELAHIAGINDRIVITGTLNGKIQMERKSGKIRIIEGILESGKSGGQIIYQPDEYPAFLSGEDERFEILRNAFTSFDYDELEFVFKGLLQDEMQANLTARGYNRKTFGNRPLHIELNLEGAIPLLLRTTTNY